MNNPFIVVSKRWRCTAFEGSSYKAEPEFRLNDGTIMDEQEFNNYYVEQKANGIDIVIV